MAEVRAVYTELATRPADRACALRSGCCHFRLTGRTPYLTKGEALVMAQGVRAAGRKELPEREDGACPMLHPRTERCMAYTDRPFGCRTHFCKEAGGPYERREVVDLIHRLEQVDTALGGDGARLFHGAVEAALEELTVARPAKRRR